MDNKFPNKISLNAKSVAIIGGGLAGVAAAWMLHCSGYKVVLIEKRPFLGGRAYSFTDSATGVEVDNGQHVFMRCFSEYISLVKQVGSFDKTKLQSSMNVEVRDSGGNIGVLSSSPLPSYLSFLPSFLFYRYLSINEKIKAILVLLKIKFIKNIQSEDLQNISFKDWLKNNNQSEKSIRNFWDLIILPTLNDHSSNVTTSMALMVFKTTLLGDRHASDIGFAQYGLSTVMGTPMKDKLVDCGVSLVLGKQVLDLKHSKGVITELKLSDGQKIKADFYISAIPPFALMSLLPNSLKKTELGLAGTHDFSPIINAHIWYDKTVADFEWTAFINSPLQYVFNRSVISNLDQEGTYLTISISGASEFWSKTKEQLKELLVDELNKCLPLTASAKIKRFIIIKEQRATFRNLPGASINNRLKSATPLDNFYLAGDWTDTGWPSTMEGAVISGNLAAKAIIARDGSGN